MKSYLQIIRPKNLILVAVSQLLIYYVYILPITDGNITLSNGLWWLFILDTVLIAAGGYVINDIYDRSTDQINKPTNTFIKDGALSIGQTQAYYWGIVVIGFLIAAYIAYSIHKLHLLAIYPTAVAALFFYSKSWKKMPYIGNLVVVLFCAMVPGIVWYAEIDVINELKISDPTDWQFLTSVFVAYIVFAALSTAAREMVKDIEDIEGDQLQGYQTAPIATSVSSVKVVIMISLTLLICSYYLWVARFESTAKYVMTAIVGTLMVAPSLWILIQVRAAQAKHHYSSISKYLKYLMAVSLFVFLCIPFINKYL